MPKRMMRTTTDEEEREIEKKREHAHKIHRTTRVPVVTHKIESDSEISTEIDEPNDNTKKTETPNYKPGLFKRADTPYPGQRKTFGKS